MRTDNLVRFDEVKAGVDIVSEEMRHSFLLRIAIRASIAFQDLVLLAGLVVRYTQ